MLSNSSLGFHALNTEITSCTRCPRLVEYREHTAITKRKSFITETYWGKPIHGFGDPAGRLLVSGLAPAAHGANRTGRVFTGDQSARFLMRCLQAAGFANQEVSEHVNDGLQLIDTYITCAVKCVPPENKPTSQEQAQCQSFLRREISEMRNLKVVLALGKFAFSSYYKLSAEYSSRRSEPRFIHGKRYSPESGLPVVYGSYHPSPRNTNTGLLTESSFLEILQRIQRDLGPRYTSDLRLD